MIGIDEVATDIGARIGAHPGDSQDVRLRKSMLVMSTLMFIGAGLLWGLMYFALGEISAGWIPNRDPSASLARSFRSG